jgi:hypothetical protein
MTNRQIWGFDMEETLYIKRGRRYQVWGNVCHATDVMKAGSFRLTHCIKEGHTRYTSAVTPDTAAFLAACSVAQNAMEEAILEKAKSAPGSSTVLWTAEQKRLIQQFRDDMAATGALVPDYWKNSTAYEIAQAGIDAVRASVNLS